MNETNYVIVNNSSLIPLKKGFLFRMWGKVLRKTLDVLYLLGSFQNILPILINLMGSGMVDKILKWSPNIPLRGCALPDNPWDCESDEFSSCDYVVTRKR